MTTPTRDPLCAAPNPQGAQATRRRGGHPTPSGEWHCSPACYSAACSPDSSLAVLILEASLRRFPASVYTQVRQVELAHLDDLATVLLPAALLATATLVVVTIARPGRTRWLALTALVLLLATFIISVLISVPINTDQQRLVCPRTAQRLGPRARPLADRSLVRTTTAVCAFITLAAATIARRAPSRHTA